MAVESPAVVGSATAIPAVSAEGLAAAFGGRVVWRDATFSIAPGRFVTVLGPNGAGKSTLLRLLLGLLPPAAGRLEVLGSPPRRGSSAIGYVPQRRALDVDLPVRGRDLVRLGVDGHRFGPPMWWRRGHVEAQVDAALAAVGALAYADRPVGRLSGGEQQRILLAQALVGEPQLLLLDEPLANLDLLGQAAMVTLVSSLARQRRVTVILVAHDINPIVGVADDILFVAKGRVLHGTPPDLLNGDVLSRIYGAPIEVLRDRHGRVVVVGLEHLGSHRRDGGA